MRFKGTIIITDPCYLMEKDTEGWKNSDCGQDLSVIGLTDYISKDTIYGDWSCMTYKGTEKEVSNLIIEWDKQYIEFYNTYNFEGLSEGDKIVLSEEFYKEKSKFKKANTLGGFCADAGMVCVAYLDEVLKYNPDFADDIEQDWLVTVIKDFDGEVDYIIDGGDEVHLVGTGNINFFTAQSDF